MANRQERGTFWVVTTHVLTTGPAFPLIAGIAVVVLAMQLGRTVPAAPPRVSPSEG